MQKYRIDADIVTSVHESSNRLYLARYERDGLTDLEESLNRAKDLLNGLDENTIVEYQRNSPLGQLRLDVRQKYGAQHVTNAWLKYWELATMVQKHIRPNTKFFFNAEFPGSGILALNHFYYAKYGKPLTSWMASSYVPQERSSSNTILEDSYGIYKMNREKWVMTRTNNGDMRNVDNIIDLCSRFNAEECGRKSSKAPSGFDFYMHDAGIDVSSDYNSQEAKNITLHLGCALAGFVLLRPGGVFVAKQYTFFKTISWQLILLYATLFENFYIVKPVASRAANSEIYLVGLGYRGIGHHYVFLISTLRLLTKDEDEGKDIGDYNIFADFPERDRYRQYMEKLARQIADKQIVAIKDYVNDLRSGGPAKTRDFKFWYSTVAPLVVLPRGARVKTMPKSKDRRDTNGKGKMKIVF